MRKMDGINANEFSISGDGLPAEIYIYEVMNGVEIIKRGKLLVEE